MFCIIILMESLLESSRHELRQAVPFPEAVLQEGDHEEDREKPETGLPVLSPLPSLTGLEILPSPQCRYYVLSQEPSNA